MSANIKQQKKNKRFQGPPYYYQRVSVEEQNRRLRERLARKTREVEYAAAHQHEAEDERDKLREENAKLRKIIDALEEQNARLRAQLRPRWIKPNKTLTIDEQTQQSGHRTNKTGAKLGHKPHNRTLPAKIDLHVNLVATHCPNCNQKLSKPCSWHSHTQVDLPEIRPTIVTCYHVAWSYCKTCDESVSVAHKLSRSKYGPRLHAWVGYLKFGMGLTYPKIQLLLQEQYNLDISTGELSEMMAQDATKFFYCYEDLKENLKKQNVIYADETGWRKGANNAWLWSFSSKRLSYYTIEKGRNKDVVIDTLGQRFDGILSSDFLGSYTAIDCEKQKCWVHLLRECRELKAKYPDNKEVFGFTKNIRRFYDRAVAIARKKNKLHAKYHQSLLRLQSDTDKFIKHHWHHPELITLAKRMKHHRDALYTFIRVGIEPHNNNAEREIRPAVLMRKTSYCNRSDRGARTQAVWMSLIRSCQKQHRSPLAEAAAFLKSA